MACGKCEFTGFAWGDIPCECMEKQNNELENNKHLPAGKIICAKVRHPTTLSIWNQPGDKFVIQSYVENAANVIFQENKASSWLASGYLTDRNYLHSKFSSPAFLVHQYPNGVTKFFIFEEDIEKVFE